MTTLNLAVRKLVPTVSLALKTLAAMERQLTTAKTYDEIRRVIKEATALKVLINDVAEVKEAAENAILLGNKRIAEELRKVPKASGRPAKIPSAQGRNKSAGRHWRQSNVAPSSRQARRSVRRGA